MNKTTPSRFTLRVYGILSSSDGKVLLSQEQIEDFAFTKFPGDGLEFGEGTAGCVEREFQEETGIAVEVGELLYVTDFFVQSHFDAQEQVIAIYYLVKPLHDLKESDEATTQPFRGKTNILKQLWVPLSSLSEQHLSFDTDKAACRKLLVKLRQ